MESITNLPINEKSFEISIKGDTSGQMWTGKFKTVCMPNCRQRAEATISEKQLNRDLKTLDDDTILYHRMIAQLQSRLMGAPDWWIASGNGQELLDLNVVFEVWRQCASAEKEWRDTVWGVGDKEEEKKKKKAKKIESTSGEDEATE